MINQFKLVGTEQSSDFGGKRTVRKSVNQNYLAQKVVCLYCIVFISLPIAAKLAVSGRLTVIITYNKMQQF